MALLWSDKTLDEYGLPLTILDAIKWRIPRKKWVHPKWVHPTLFLRCSWFYRMQPPPRERPPRGEASLGGINVHSGAVPRSRGNTTSMHPHNTPCQPKPLTDCIKNMAATHGYRMSSVWYIHNLPIIDVGIVGVMYSMCSSVMVTAGSQVPRLTRHHLRQEAD